MRRYSVLHPIVYAFFSADLYRDVARHWRGAAFLYLLLLLAICGLPPAIHIHRTWSQFSTTHGAALVDQIPPIDINNGIVSVDAAQPHFVTDPQDGTVLAVIDTTGAIGSLDETAAFVLLTQDQVMIRKKANEIRVYDLSGVDQLSVDRQMLHAWLERTRAMAGFVYYPLALLGTYGYRVVQALFYAVIGLLMGRVVGAGLNYPSLLAVAVVAVTPAIVARTFLGVVGVQPPSAWLIYFLAAMIYLYFGIRATVTEPATEWSTT